MMVSAISLAPLLFLLKLSLDENRLVVGEQCFHSSVDRGEYHDLYAAFHIFELDKSHQLFLFRTNHFFGGNRSTEPDLLAVNGFVQFAGLKAGIFLHDFGVLSQ